MIGKVFSTFQHKMELLIVSVSVHLCVNNMDKSVGGGGGRDGTGKILPTPEAAQQAATPVATLWQSSRSPFQNSGQQATNKHYYFYTLVRTFMQVAQRTAFFQIIGKKSSGISTPQAVSLILCSIGMWWFANKNIHQSLREPTQLWPFISCKRLFCSSHQPFRQNKKETH